MGFVTQSHKESKKPLGNESSQGFLFLSVVKIQQKGI
jgi:hypothetical protein